MINGTSFADIPRNLTYLQIGEVITRKGENGMSSAIDSLHLPRSLTSLSIRRCVSNSSEAGWFAGLPTGLRELDVGILSFKIFSHIPCPQMHTLTINTTMHI
jgi:hypothetical protein